MEFLQPINDMLVAELGPLGPVAGVFGLGIVMMAMVIPVLLRRQVDPLSKLKQNRRDEAAAAIRQSGDGGGKRLRHGAGGTDKLERFATFLEPKTEEEMSSARLKLLRAGYRGRNAVRTFHAAQFLLGIGFLSLGVLYALISAAGQPLDTTNLIMSVIMPGAAGYYLPRYWVERRVQARQQDIQDGFPDALDMLLVCVEAGQSLDQAIVRVSKELKAAFPALAEEFETIAAEVKAGKDKASVMRSFAERSGVPDVSSFVTVMIQSQTFGTSIAEALRVYAAEMRDKRVMRAEEKANKLPTKMTLGTMFFTVPPLLIILVGPSVYDMLQLFSQAMQ
jgi:tight adherence protein C